MSSAERVAAVTGGTSGIGREVARKLAEAGAAVAVAGRNEAEGAETVRQIEAGGGTAWFTTLDVSDVAAVERWVHDAHERGGRLDWLVNNAGMNGRSARLEECSIEEFELVIRVNLTAAFASMHAAIPIMRAQGGGAI